MTNNGSVPRVAVIPGDGIGPEASDQLATPAI
jgi:isocitrate/isopropylmalate dehydrogenase